MKPNFPNCCPLHQTVFEDTQKWFEKFPNCCERHALMVRKWGLKKNEYEGLPRKILDGLAFTEYHISKQIERPDWYEDITNYMHYNWWNFGHPNIGGDLYYIHLKQILEMTTDIPKSKKARLIEYIDSENTKSDDQKLDLNLLWDTYQKWLKTFPFQLPYFKGIHERLKSTVPVFKEPLRFNPYTGLYFAKVFMQGEMVDFLEAATKHLIAEVQTDEFKISDLKKHRLQLSNESLRVQTSKLVEGYSKGELRYVAILKKWLELQKKYFKEVVEITGNTRQAETSKPLRTQPTFAGLFENDEAMSKALMAARNCGLINERGQWALIGPKTYAASAFWKAAVTSGLGIADMAKTSVSKAISEHFRVKLGKNAIGIDKGEFDQGLYTNLLAAMKAM